MPTASTVTVRPWRRLTTTALATALIVGPASTAALAGVTPAPAATDATQSSPTTYELTELAAPAEGNASFPLGLTAQGDVVGTARTTSARLPQLATRWSNGEATSLGSLPGSTFSRAFAQNARGEAVGEATAANGATRAVLFAPDGTVRDLGTLEGSNSAVANDINARGTAVGVSGGTATVFGKNGPAALPPLDAGVAGTSRADAINDRGQVAGFAPATVEGSQSPVGQAALWTPRGQSYTVTAMDRLEPGRFARAYDINAAGTVVGEASRSTETGASVTRAVRWDRQAVTELDPLRDYRFTRANAVNQGGDIVGHATGFFGFSTIDGAAVLWDEGIAHDLNDLVLNDSDLVLRSAEDIDDSGRIIGFGTVDGETRGFLLTPVQ
jgi:probable HAF family extracellular repeat protein